MKRSYIESEQFESIDYTEKGFGKGEYEDCIFRNCNFSGVDLTNVIFLACEFEACDMTLK